MATAAKVGGMADTEVPAAATLVERARAMIPVLRERSARAAAERRIPDETIAEIRAAGLFRILQPRRWGGYEMHPNTFFDVQRLLAEGCMSTGWVYGVLGCHPYEIALFPEAAQQEVWGADNAVLASSSYQPVGKVEHVAGGFRLSGRWGFSSGCEHCDWVLLGAVVPPKADGEAPDMRTFLLPRADYRIDDKWDTFGLRGTGSQDIVVEQAFVPDYRTHRSADGFLCRNPGQETNGGPLYSLPWAQIFVRSVSSAALGGACAGIQAALTIAQDRVSTNTGKASKSDPALLAAIARAVAEVGEMELALRTSFATMMTQAERGEAVAMSDRALFRYQSSTVVRRCAGLIDDLLPLLGGRAIYMSSPIIQPWLDLNAARAHVANDPGNMAPDLVNGLMGAEPAFLFL